MRHSISSIYHKNSHLIDFNVKATDAHLFQAYLRSKDNSSVKILKVTQREQPTIEIVHNLYPCDAHNSPYPTKWKIIIEKNGPDYACRAVIMLFSESTESGQKLDFSFHILRHNDSVKNGGHILIISVVEIHLSGYFMAYEELTAL